jgi:DNA repair protein RadC
LKKEVGGVRALKLKAMFELFKIANRGKRKGFKPTIESAKDVYNYFVDEMKDRKREYFYALLLDSKNKVIKEELISVGTLNSSLVHPREVFKEAIKASANALILVHNHTSGDANSLREDDVITRKIIEAGEMLNIKVLDHIIITKDDWWSLKKPNLQ